MSHQNFRSKGAPSARMYCAVALATAASSVGLSSCGADVPQGEAHPPDALYYPTSLSIHGSADGSGIYLSIVNANFDKRFRSGWISTIDLKALAEQGGLNGNVPRSELNVLSLGGRLVFSPDGSQAALGHRGDGIITLMAVGSEAASKLSCGAGGDNAGLDTDEKRTDCDRAHMAKIEPISPLEGEENEITTDAVRDPYSISFGQSAAGEALVAVGYLSTRWVSLFDFGTASSPSLSWRTAVRLGTAATSQVAFHTPAGTVNDAFLVGAKAYTKDGGSMMLHSVSLSELRSDPTEVAPWPVSLGTNVGTSDVSDMIFSTDGSVALVASAAPAAVVLLRPRLRLRPADGEEASAGAGDAGQVLDFEVQHALALPAAPTAITFVERLGDARPLIAVACKDDDAVYFVATVGDIKADGDTTDVDESRSLRLVSRFDDVGAGPVALAATKLSLQREAGQPAEESVVLAVANFFDHSLTLLDVSAEEPSSFEQIARIESPSIDEAERVN